MTSANRHFRRHAALVAAAALTSISATLLFAPAGFGGSWKCPNRYDSQPILQVMDTTVFPGGTADCYVSITPTVAARARGGAVKDTTATVHIFSDPAGAVSYDGPVSGAADVVQAAVSPGAPAGPVRVYLQTQDGTVTSDTTTVAP